MPLALLAWTLSFASTVLAVTSPQEEGEVHTAPEQHRQDAPPEATLTPPPDAEKAQPMPGFVEIRNPAFPGAEPLPVAQSPAPDLGRKYEAADLSSYFSDGVLAEAKASFDRGHYAVTREKLKDAGDAPPVRYLRALAAVRGELHAEAAEEMASLADAYPAMRDRCLTHAGTAYEALKQYDRAAELLAQVPRGSKMYAEARLALFRSLKAANRLDDAIAALAPQAEKGQPSWGRNVGAEALWEIAQVERSRKRADAEREALLELWARHPLTSLAKQAEARLDLKKVPLERHVERAEALVDAHRNRAGIAHLQPFLSKLKLPDPVACHAHFIHGKALRKEREHSDAIRALTPVMEQCDDPQLRPRAMYVLGSSRSIVQMHTGPGVYEALANDYPEHSFADDALFYAADVYLHNEEVEKALQRLAELAERYPEGDFAAEGLFKSFWIRKQQGETEKAHAILDQIERTFANADETYEVERAKYWRARLLQKAGETQQAVDIFAKLATDHPATYYGLISRRRVAELDEARAMALSRELHVPGAGSVWPLHAGPLSDDPHFLAGIELFRMGFHEAVSSELLAANRTRAPAEAIRLVVHVLSMAGDARAAHAVARTALRRDLSGQVTAQTRPIWEVAYPQAFRELIVKHCKTARIEPDLLQALMREESALDPRALSWAGALGLTQLMPYTAKAVARRLKLRDVTTSRLFEPDLNIQIGAAYLGDLVKRFDGTYEYALAGYNAGGGAVSKWRRERPELDLDEWVEEIPISETRGYVKRVLRSYNTYRLLYPEDATEVSAAK